MELSYTWVQKALLGAGGRGGSGGQAPPEARTAAAARDAIAH
jgi:hypothetical protein